MIILDMHVIYSCHTNVLIYCLIFKQLHKHVEVTVCENLIGRCSSHLVKSLDKTERFIFGKIYMYHVFTLSFTVVSSFSRWTDNHYCFQCIAHGMIYIFNFESVKNRNVISWCTCILSLFLRESKIMNPVILGKIFMDLIGFVNTTYQTNVPLICLQESNCWFLFAIYLHNMKNVFNLIQQIIIHT